MEKQNLSTQENSTSTDDYIDKIAVFIGTTLGIMWGLFLISGELITSILKLVFSVIYLMFALATQVFIVLCDIILAVTLLKSVLI